ncbi:MAG TPA: hypothetical protein VFG45_02985 [Candidatus Nitrosocosmicus sp.]|jgi:hypothetical protein|uniref:hypothetical protein n=1 Tax=Candidatus Nitrosocosmicus agrestis TaxID=2563600 RepID=UPI00122E6AB8|nr:hypothetical protein [Candidatus Nitrosocosmicus sp. SS]KAA2281552.1 hypothetical protein F1Z66_07830 [Candidatus Nitrosocosmicus sp. SS]KAF0869755.1 hypothetical protein E5N71_03105 [Candidatus Nitrosocosmicus sp. SS]MDR4490351.1 hypothetical protein [Candidatus Nitrosocosmicus sp.]HET6589110.1 hypothetical protein [Candidatus Nitrosocosmicus sp.]
MQFIKYNKVLVKPDKRDDRTKAILAFFKLVQTKDAQMRGFIVMGSLENLSETIVLTFLGI